MYGTFILRLNIRISERSTECQRSPPIPPIPGFPVVDIPSSGLLVPFFIKEFLKKQFVDNHSQTQCLPDAIHVPVASQMAAILPTIETEVSFDVSPSDGYQNAVRAVNDVIELVTSYSIRGKYPLNVAIEMRLIGYSDIYLSPAQAGMSVICRFIVTLS